MKFGNKFINYSLLKYIIRGDYVLTIAKILPLKALLLYESWILADYERTLEFLKKSNENLLEDVSDKKLEHAFKRALKTPAYVNFLKRHGIKPKPLNASEIENTIPITDKKNYVKVYPHEQRCIKGMLPKAGNIDESAGSSGKPTDWVRSYKEELLLLKAAYFEYMYVFNPKEAVIVVSAWSTGPWATGVKFCELTEHFSLVKNTGTDKDDIKNTLRTFGKKYRYIIAGYPLFLQSLFETDFPWKEYSIDVLTGGDGYSVAWPEKIRLKLKPGAKIASSYGCSDIDIGIGFETPLCQKIREEAAKNKELAKELFGKLQTIPMIFQYNPLLHCIHIHNLPTGEFAITHLDCNVASPKIKYNIHDLGGSISFSSMADALKRHSCNVLEKEETLLHLPFLYVAGRSDGTLSFDGANVFPEQIDIVLTKHFLNKVSNFKMMRREKRNQPFQIMVELRKGIRKSKSLQKEIEEKSKENLPSLNKDYEESLKNNERLAPAVELFSKGEGPFKETKKIKYKFVEK